MFKQRRPMTLIGEGSKVGGGVSAAGMVEVNGSVKGDIDCSSLLVSKSGCVKGKVAADSVVVAGVVDGPVICSRLHLKSGARVIGDIQYDTLIVDQGGHFAGRSLEKVQSKTEQQPKKEKTSVKSVVRQSSAKTRKASNADVVTAPKLRNAGSTSPA